IGIVPSLYCVYNLQKDITPSIIQLYFEDKNRLDSYLFPLVNVGARNNVNITDLEFLEGNVILPKSSEEQSKIAQLIEQLNTTITLQQRKLELLKKLKRGSLQQMFPQNKESVPKVRFADFDEEWEQHKFFDNIENIIDFRGRTPKKLGMNWSKDGYLALSALNVKNGFIDPKVDAHYGNKKLYDKWMRGHELRKGQVLFTTEAPMGNVAQVPDNKKYILSQRTIAFTLKKDKITDDFLATLLRTPKSFNELTSLSSGGTAKGVSQRSLSQFKIMTPQRLIEQRQIGAFFKHLDDTITLRQQKLTLLKQLKKAFLQKMFI
ncbi:restriction endonuclease subunit S, partial [Liquorilactobacillus satsumensis]|uniref:restriction endonuclease subunit S n=1 Tax=Liquorilactobacillus satsumensis TaxID=259059 RepID=UPI0039E7A93F